MISTPIKDTCTHVAAHLEGVSHNAITDYVRHARLTARQVWKVVQRCIQDHLEAFLIVDESVLDNRSSQNFELVKRQYSGTQHGIVRGISVVTIVHAPGQPHDFSPINDRIHAPEGDGKTKHEHAPHLLRDCDALQ